MINLVKKEFVIIVLIANFFYACSSTKKEKDLPSKQNQVELKKEIKIDLKPSEVTELSEEKIKSDVESALIKGNKEVTFLASEYFFKAADYSMRGESEQAELLYRYLLVLKPNDLFIKKKYAVELIKEGKLEESVPLLKEVIKSKDEQSENISLILAGVLTALEKSKEARKIYRQILSKNPENEEACIFLAKGLAADGKFTQADVLLAKCQRKMKSKAIFSYYRGKLALSIKKEKKAISYFDKALKVDPHFYQAALGKGLIYESRGRFKKALKTYEKFIIKNPMNYGVLSKIVQLKFQLKDLNGIVDYTERLVSLDPSDLNLKVQLGILYSDKHRLNDAIGVFKEILVEVPNSDKILFYLGTLSKEIQSADEALEYFSKINEESPLFYDSAIQMAQILKEMIRLGDVDRKNEFLSFVKINGQKHQPIRFRLGIILTTYLEESGYINQAIGELEKLRVNDEYGPGHDYYLASLYDKSGDFKNARVAIERVIKNDPENAHAYNFLGYTLLERGVELDLAYDYIKKAVQLNPEDGYIRDSLGWYYFKVGKYKKALKELAKAEKLVGKDYIVSKHMAMVYEKLSKYSKAESYYREAIKLCQVPEEKAEMKKMVESVRQKRLPASVK